MPRLPQHLALIALLFCLFIAAPGARAQGSEPSREPVLRVETGMHTAVIHRIGVDAANRYLVTASDDKTVRVWELPAGRLLRVIRVPLGAGNEGKLYAVALSPDGSTIAAGGQTSTDGLLESIYLFDRESGRLTGRLGGLPFPVLHLAYSPDGRFLAATLFGKSGVRVFSTSPYAPAGEDRDYGDSSYGADFDRAGRLATVSDDSFIRLYATGRNGSLRLLAKQKAEGDPQSISFSPDGTRLAVGFYDSTKVAVLRSDDLSLLYAPDTTGVNNDNLFSVAWSADGRTLYAGGRAQDANHTFFIRAWADGGRGGYRDIAGAAADTIQHMLPLRDGGIVYGASGPAFGVIDASGRRQLFITAAIADYRNNRQGFLLAPDGTGVQFAYQQFGQASARFSLADRKLDAAPASQVSWRPPETEDSRLRVTDWHNKYTPKLNGTPLKLKQYEFSRSLALAPDRSAFLLGADFYLRLFDRNGAERWQIAVPGEAWAVNISADGRLAVAAYGDGTIRWYRMTDGRELLAFFPHADRKRWILWTPSGYYDASPGAEDLIGWHVNNGRDAAADFYPASRFFEQFYRPDIVSEVVSHVETDREVIARLGERPRLDISAGIKRPPRVSFISPQPGSTFELEEIEISVMTQDLGGGVDEVRLYQNGKLVGNTTREIGLALEAAKRRFNVQLVEGVNRFTAVALSRERVEGDRAEMSVTLKGATQTVDLYCIFIGINRYKNPVLNLNYAVPDAEGLHSFFDAPGLKRLFRNVNIYPLLNENATLAQIQATFAKVQQQTRPQDTVVIYMAGHGDVAQNQWYFIPHDLTTPEDESDLQHGAISTAQIGEALIGMKAQKILVMLDSCKSGEAVMKLLGYETRKAQSRGYEDRKALVQLARSTGTYILSATTETQLAAEVKSLGHGVFTYVLLEGLNGKAGGNKVTVEGLILYIKNTLPDVTAKYRGAPQYPISRGFGYDFPLVLLGNEK